MDQKIPTVPVEVYTTYFAVGGNVRGILTGTDLNAVPFIDNYLTTHEYNNRFRRWFKHLRFCRYDFVSERLIFPRYALDAFLNFLYLYKCKGVQTQMDHVDIRTITTIWDDDYKERDEAQVKMIEHITTSDLPITYIEAFMGTGKTFVTIKSMVILSYATLIIADGLYEQWQKSILMFTKLIPEDIHIIAGFESVKQIFDIPKHQLPKVFLATSKTLSLWISKEGKYKEVPSYVEFLEYAGIGLKVGDESHQSFHTNVVIDMHSNVKVNLKLSATPERSKATEQRIFTLVYPPHLIYDAGNRKSYVNTTMYGYLLNDMKRTTFDMIKGYNQFKYESYLLQNPKLLKQYTSLIGLLVQRHYLEKRKPKQKLLIFAATKAMIYVIHEYLNTRLADEQLKIVTYLGGDKESVIDGVDIIISTPKKTGTGVDIPNLKVVIQTISLLSRPAITQSFGRLRELQDDTPEFIDLYNRNISAHIRHKRAKEVIYKRLAKKYFERNHN